MGFKTKARAWRDHYFSLAEEGHEMVKNEIVSSACPRLALALADTRQAKGTARPSLTSRALTEGKPGEHPDDIIMFSATQVYTGERWTLTLLSEAMGN